MKKGISMDPFISKKITPHVHLITGITNEKMYLVIGKNRACLVDTGIGYGNIKNYVASITQLPVTVILTHGHLDHTGGVNGFEEVYLDRKDWKLLRTDYTKARAALYIKEVSERREINLAYLPDCLEVQVKELSDGMIFDLGGMHVEIIACPGHTKGSVAVLLRDEKKLIIGDACNHATYLFGSECTSVKEYKECLEKLIAREREWDEVWFSHYDYKGEKKIVSGVLNVCDLVLKGKDDKIPFDFLGNRGILAMEVTDLVSMARKDGKTGNIIYR